MRFLIIRRADEETEAGVPGSEEMFTAMTRYNEELAKAGVLLDGAGLQPSSKGAKVRFSGSRRTVIDGPFTEAKELIAGYTIIEVDSLADAIELVKKWPKVDGHGNATIEIRRVAEIEDFDTASPEVIEIDRRIREQTGKG
ncbi:MAG: YciI family protein [Actinophytocola sp.]|uniref:YciI family protein n=1 Tax=Actinophytocola sp. TaxID=1872138 RepID=UPI003D6C6808